MPSDKPEDDARPKPEAEGEAIRPLDVKVPEGGEENLRRREEWLARRHARTDAEPKAER